MTAPAPIDRDAHLRSLLKGVSWRIVGSIDTFLIGWIVTGSPMVAGTISAIEVFTKIFLFYLHERVWGKVRWGRRLPIASESAD